MESFPFLSALVFFPLLGVLLLCLMKSEETFWIRAIALGTTIATFLFSLVLLLGFQPSLSGYHFEEQATLLGGIFGYHLGVDGVSLAFILLTTFLMPLCILASRAVQHRLREYMMAFLVLEVLILGVFSALDLILFYLFFEASLVPMFLIVGIWGGERRIYASFKFFLYTFLGSVFMLIAMIVLSLKTGTTDLVMLEKHLPLPFNLQIWLWLGFFLSFAVKIPMWPVHTWLPDAHVEAPTAGSVVLAAVLLKMGGYGFYRFSLPLFPLASDFFSPLVLTLSVIAIVYASLVAFVQKDMKKLIAYSSVAHMGFVTMGLFSLTRQGIDGALFQMISHGFVSAALFLCVGVVYDRIHTREIAAYGGLVERMPIYAFFFMAFTMANVALPGTSGFVGEFLSLLGAFSASRTLTLLATLGVILSALYALRLYREVIFGVIRNPALVSIKDLTGVESGVFIVLLLGVLIFGVYPAPVLDLFSASVSDVLQQIQKGLVMIEGGR